MLVDWWCDPRPLPTPHIHVDPLRRLRRLLRQAELGWAADGSPLVASVAALSIGVLVYQVLGWLVPSVFAAAFCLIGPLGYAVSTSREDPRGAAGSTGRRARAAPSGARDASHFRRPYSGCAGQYPRFSRPRSRSSSATSPCCVCPWRMPCGGRSRSLTIGCGMAAWPCSNSPSVRVAPTPADPGTLRADDARELELRRTIRAQQAQQIDSARLVTLMPWLSSSSCGSSIRTRTSSTRASGVRCCCSAAASRSHSGTGSCFGLRRCHMPVAW